MKTYLVTPTDTRTPAFRVAATDEVDLGAKIAQHLARHRQLTPGPYEAQIGTERGAIRQQRRTVTFAIRADERPARRSA